MFQAPFKWRQCIKRKAADQWTGAHPETLICTYSFSGECFLPLFFCFLCCFFVHDSHSVCACRSALTPCWVFYTGAGPLWFWAWRSCGAWKAFSTPPPCWTWRDFVLWARAACVYSGSTFVKYSQLQVRAMWTQAAKVFRQLGCESQNDFVFIEFMNWNVFHW